MEEQNNNVSPKENFNLNLNNKSKKASSYQYFFSILFLVLGFFIFSQLVFQLVNFIYWRRLEGISDGVFLYLFLAVTFFMISTINNFLILNWIKKNILEKTIFSSRSFQMSYISLILGAIGTFIWFIGGFACSWGGDCGFVQNLSSFFFLIACIPLIISLKDVFFATYKNKKQFYFLAGISFIFFSVFCFAVALIKK